MGASSNCLPAMGAAVLLMLIAAAAVLPASASTLTVFEGPGCSGKSKDITGCGCFDLENYNGGFHFVYTEGQTAELKVSHDCTTREFPEVLERETRSCISNDYKVCFGDGMKNLQSAD
ncbi:unnamed protein product [Spirodela intermedia]|uniref:Uncharacterized protein n=1 Tax=Spirodela intermedia TaxID=51605 RepID=A0ABN7EA65_SPIIN|nr:unnamed protein product [Spirodela intermedia]CAA6674764.1 unnamed protein product [Spirodela intermedia]